MFNRQGGLFDREVTSFREMHYDFPKLLTSNQSQIERALENLTPNEQTTK